MRKPQGNAPVDTPTSDENLEALSKYGIDLTANAATLDPVIGRDEEIRRMIRVLCRRTKNNPVLIGDPGVGKVSRLLPVAFSQLDYCSGLNATH